MVTRAFHLAAVSLLLSVTIFAGCAKRPAMTQASAPPPAVAPAPVAAPPPPPPPPVVVQETVKETVTATPVPAPAAPAQPAPRPAPKEFAVNPNVKDIFFDFDKYNIRPGDAKILDENAAWLKANPGQLVLIEGHADERGCRAQVEGRPAALVGVLGWAVLDRGPRLRS